MTNEGLELAEAIRFGEALLFDVLFLKSCGIAQWTAEEEIGHAGE
jgi:hypothetical protein